MARKKKAHQYHIFHFRCLDCGDNLFKAICLKVVSIVLETLLSVALVALGINYYSKTNCNKNNYVETSSKLTSSPYSISKISYLPSQELVQARKTILGIT
ncbi:MAG: hypothetical protein H0W50_08465 [Parachlamydiaceae bacterium]|nr:hypothetical protein [Parachlamydiaceae bacterium]